MGAATWPLVPPYRPAGGKLWIAPLPPDLHRLTDRPGRNASRLRLTENERLLGAGHAPHADIERFGGGRYSFWQDVLYFSSSDGGDPNTNSYSYAVTNKAGVPNIPDLSVIADAPVWEPLSTPLRCAFFGMGNRGRHLAKSIQQFAGVQAAWFVDRLGGRLAEASSSFPGAAEAKTSADWSEALSDPSVALVFVTLPDHLHRQAAEAAFRAGKHVYLEKPIATSSADATAIVEAWRVSGRLLQVGYVLRRTPFYRAIRILARSGLLGTIRQIVASEQLDTMHGASFMRRWHGISANSGGLIVHKACHDLDIICWLLGARPIRVSSFGGRNTFDRIAPARFCSECSERLQCAYADDGSHEYRTQAEAENPTAFGLDRCVFDKANDIVDNQVVAFELETGARGVFTLAVQGRRTERRISIIGDQARLDGCFEDGRFSVEFADEAYDSYTWEAHDLDEGSHGGGDMRLLYEFLNMCAGREPPSVDRSEDLLAGLTFAFAAENSRKNARVETLCWAVRADG